MEVGAVVGDQKRIDEVFVGRKHYRHELDNGQVKATAKVAESLFRKATGEGPQSMTAAIFWLKTKGGWREMPQTHEVGIFDLNRVTDQELELMLEFTQGAIARNGHRSASHCS